MKTFPVLFKKTNTGAIQEWRIAVDGTTITVEHGQVNGKFQSTSDTIKEGKNIGRSNETTPEQQAEAEAEARWTKQKKKGYVESYNAAVAGEVDAVIEGGILPMLAPSKIYPHFANKLEFPIFVQPKLDGSRCIAIVENGTCTLWSRTRKRINSVPHIETAVLDLYKENDLDGRLILDGELYADAYSDNFEELMSIIRKDKPDQEGKYKNVEYHVYDLPSCNETFARRHEDLVGLFWDDDIREYLKRKGSIVLVNTVHAFNDNDIKSLHENNLEDGFEGSMLRNDGPYEGGKRSMHLQKLKTMVDAENNPTGLDTEFEIVRAEEGRGKDVGTVGAFVCINKMARNLDGKEFKEFKCRLKASYDRRRELFEHPEQWKGMYLTVVYQNLTTDGIPRFPIGKGLRSKDRS
jgi:ATP-dependent DNA ligase